MKRQITEEPIIRVGKTWFYGLNGQEQKEPKNMTTEELAAASRLQEVFTKEATPERLELLNRLLKKGPAGAVVLGHMRIHFSTYLQAIACQFDLETRKLRCDELAILGGE